jgi:uncharacterized protein YdaU (DUF1376 family)
MHYYKRNLGDYAKKAGRLSMLQHGSYTLLIDACYDREQFPTREDAIEWTWASSLAEIEAVEFVLRKFFVLDGGVYVQSRIAEEIAEYHSKSATNKRIATERETNRKEKGTNRALVVNEPPPNHKPLTINQEPLTKNQEPETNRVNPELVGESKAVVRASRLRADWVLPKGYGDWALQEKPSWSAEDVRKVADIFRDHWRAKGGKDAAKLDWLATWRNWVRKEPDAPKRGSGQFLTAQQQRDQNNAKASAEFVKGSELDILDGIAKVIT